MYPIRILRETSPQNNRSPSRFPTPVRGCLDKNSIPVEEVKEGGVGEFRNNEGTLESSDLGLSAILGGLRIGGVNVIIMMVASAVEDGLKVGREGHWEKEKREKGEEKNERGESLMKRVINRKGNPEP